MASHTSVEGVVTVGGNVVAELRSMNLETSAEMIDATTLTSTSKVNKAGTKSFTGSIDCFWDETDTNGQITLIEGASITVVYLFEGNTSGDYSYSFTALVNSVSISSSVDGMVEASFSFTGTGAITRGTV
jgi:hypothetical protein